MKAQRFCQRCGVEVGKRKRVCGPCKVARRKELDRRYYENNREIILGKQAAWRAKNAGLVLEYNRRWRAKNPDYKLRRILRKHGILKDKAA